MIREGRKPTKAWLPSDRLLSIALTLHEQARASCGHFMDEAFGGKGDWQVDQVVCGACAAIEEHQAEHDKPDRGAKVFAFNAHESEFGDDELRPEFS